MSTEAVAEAYRGLRSTVKFAEGESPVRSVLVVDIDCQNTSSVARELSRAFARAGDECLLIDTDVRKAQSGEPGFIDLISGSIEIDEVLHDSDIKGLSLIGPGSIDDPDLLVGEGLQPVLDLLQQRFPYLILSAAPLPEHSDALALSVGTDATILVVSAGKTRRARAIDARNSLARVGARLLGVVMVERKRRWF